MANRTLASVLSFISTATREQLRQINVEAIYALRSRDAEIAGSFKPGDRVEFDSRRQGVTLRGMVVRANSRSVGVMVNGTHWRVSPGFLRKRGRR